MAGVKVITLTTLYRPKKAATNPMIEVISYKTDPRGEEFFAEFSVFEDFDFKKRFVNRLIYYSGEGGYLPFINCRVMFDIKNRKTTYGGVFTPHPSSRDYKNPFTRETDSEDTIRRISVGSIDTVFAPAGMRTFFEADVADLKDLFKIEPVLLERRVRKEKDVKEKKWTDEKESARKGKDDIKEKKRDSPNGRRESSKSNDEKKKTSDRSQGHGIEESRRDKLGEMKNTANCENEKLEKLLKICHSLAIQSSALYPPVIIGLFSAYYTTPFIFCSM